MNIYPQRSDVMTTPTNADTTTGPAETPEARLQRLRATLDYWEAKPQRDRHTRLTTAHYRRLWANLRDELQRRERKEAAS